MQESPSPEGPRPYTGAAHKGNRRRGAAVRVTRLLFFTSPACGGGRERSEREGALLLSAEHPPSPTLPRKRGREMRGCDEKRRADYRSLIRRSHSGAIRYAI